eukprot:1990564-Rhodomonas_salina.2
MSGTGIADGLYCRSVGCSADYAMRRTDSVWDTTRKRFPTTLWYIAPPRKIGYAACGAATLDAIKSKAGRYGPRAVSVPHAACHTLSQYCTALVLPAVLIQRMLLRLCYMKSGTELVYAATSSRRGSSKAGGSVVSSRSGKLSSYAVHWLVLHAVRYWYRCPCPVLTVGIALPGVSTIRGGGSANGDAVEVPLPHPPTPCPGSAMQRPVLGYAPPMPCPVLAYTAVLWPGCAMPVLKCAVVLRCCYAMCGTDRGYGATRAAKTRYQSQKCCMPIYAMCGTELAARAISAYAPCGTEAAFGATRFRDHETGVSTGAAYAATLYPSYAATPRPVLTKRMVLPEREKDIDTESGGKGSGAASDDLEVPDPRTLDPRPLDPKP